MENLKNSGYDNKIVKYIKSKIESIGILSDMEADIISISFSAYILEGETSFRSLLNEKLLDEALKYHLQMVFNRFGDLILDLDRKYNKDDLIDIVLYYEDEDKYSLDYTTPKAVSKLVFKVLDIKDGDRLLDLGSGSGKALVAAAEMGLDIDYTGVDLDIVKNTILKLRGISLGLKVDVVQEDIFKLDREMKSKFIFGDLPLEYGELKVTDQRFKLVHGLNEDEGSNYWTYAREALEHLEDDGKLILTTTDSHLNKASDTVVREEFIEAGLIETIILLPKSLYSVTEASIVLVVFSRGNKKIRMLDASEKFYRLSDYKNTLGVKDIEDIVRMLDEDSRKSRSVNLEELANLRYQLWPKMYLTELDEENSLSLGELTKDVKRGININKRELERYRSKRNTDYCFLNISDIRANEFHIDNYLNPVKVQEDSRFHENYLKEGDLIIQRTGMVSNVLVAEGIGDRKIYYSQNIYVVTVDRDIINPYYLKIFLCSKYGIRELDRKSGGATIPILSISGLKNIRIPKEDLKGQEKLVESYMSYKKEVRAQEAKLEALKSKIQEELDQFFKEKIN